LKAKNVNSWLFPLRFVVFFALTYLIWDFTAPVGARIFGGVAGDIVKFFDRADYTQKIDVQNKNIILTYRPSKNYDAVEIPLEYKGFTFNTVFLVSLIMAVPDVALRVRLKILILGLAVLFPIQVFKFVVYVFNYYSQNMRRQSQALIYPAYLHHALGYADKVLWRIDGDGQITAVLIWGALFYYYKWHHVFSRIKKKLSPVS